MTEQYTPAQLADADYVLTEGACWIESPKGFAIRIHESDEGIIVDIYDNKVLNEGDFTSALIAGTYAFTNDLEENQE